MDSEKSEKSNNSSFEDLSNLNENDLNDSQKSDETTHQDKNVDDVLDIIGNGQITKKVLTKGKPDTQPQRSEICKINLLGKLENGTIVEDYKNFTVQVGDVEVVQGVDMALPLMEIGETAEIIVDARFAYGTLGLIIDDNPAASIPGGAKIIYHVDLLSCEPEEDLDNFPYEKAKLVGNLKRERGNFWYARSEYSLAIQLYRRALEYLNDSGPGVEISNVADLTNSQLQDLLEIRVKVYNNLAAAQMKISAYDTALTSVDNVLRCQPENVKALFRKGKILEAKGEINAAIPILQKGATLDPESKAIQQLLSKCIMKSRRDARNEKDLYQKMLGHAKKIEEKSKKTTIVHEQSEVPKLKLWGYLMGSILVGVAGVAVYRYKF